MKKSFFLLVFLLVSSSTFAQFEIAFSRSNKNIVKMLGSKTYKFYECSDLDTKNLTRKGSSNIDVYMYFDNYKSIGTGEGYISVNYTDGVFYNGTFNNGIFVPEGQGGMEKFVFGMFKQPYHYYYSKEDFFVINDYNRREKCIFSNNKNFQK